MYPDLFLSVFFLARYSAGVSISWVCVSPQINFNPTMYVSHCIKEKKHCHLLCTIPLFWPSILLTSISENWTLGFTVIERCGECVCFYTHLFDVLVSVWRSYSYLALFLKRSYYTWTGLLVMLSGFSLNPVPTKQDFIDFYQSDDT